MGGEQVLIGTHDAGDEVEDSHQEDDREEL